MGKKAPKPTSSPAEKPVAREGVEIPEWWSVPRKTEVVLRLLRGETLEAVSRESQVLAHERESHGVACPGNRDRYRAAH